MDIGEIITYYMERYETNYDEAIKYIREDLEQAQNSKELKEELS